MAIVIGFGLGAFIGAYIQWNEHQPLLKKHRSEITNAYKEQEKLRMVIWELENSLPIRQAKGK